MGKTSKTVSAKYKCLVKIRLNGSSYETGDEIALTDSEAQQLLAAGAIEPSAGKAGNAGESK